MVVGVDARVAQPLGLAVLEQPEARAHLDVLVLVLDRATMSATRSTSRSVGPRPLATRHTRLAPPRSPAAACSSASSVFSHLYLRISAFEPSACEQ